MSKKPSPKSKAAVKHSAPKAPFSFRRNIVPPFLGIVVFLSVLGLLNAQWITAQAQYRFTAPSAVVNENIDTSAPSTENRITIPRINVDAPVVFDEPSFEEWKVQKALQRGTVHYGNTALPGQKGNIVVLGHSSGQLWAPGDYKFVFTLLNKVVTDDKVIIDYNGTRYIYKVTGTSVVTPDDLSVLNSTKEATLSLVTCTPVGTSKNRLVVHATQISPKPDHEPTATVDATPITAAKLPDSANKSIWQSLIDLF